MIEKPDIQGVREIVYIVWSPGTTRSDKVSNHEILGEYVEHLLGDNIDVH